MFFIDFLSFKNWASVAKTCAAFAAIVIAVPAWAATLDAASALRRTSADASAGVYSVSGPLAFERNEGQSATGADFITRGRGYTLLLQATQATFLLAPDNTSSRREDATALTIKIDGANAAAAKSVGFALPQKVNYIRGNDQTKWLQNIGVYSSIEFHNVYNGVDLSYHGSQNGPEFDFILAPGANSKDIKLRVDGAEKISIDSAGAVALNISKEKTVYLKAPRVYQLARDGKHFIRGKYVFADGVICFDIGDYDRSKALVIDPEISYSTVLGGQGGSAGRGVAIDGDHNIYVTGETNSVDFPVASAAQTARRGGTDAYVIKLSADGSRILYSTYIGGSGDDVGYAIAVDAKGQAFITGDTESRDFPLVHPVQSEFRGWVDVFVAKLSADGSKLIYSTFVGGEHGQRGQGVAIDAAGAAVVVGYTHSGDFPTKKALQPKFGGGNADAFVFKLTPDGSDFVYSTYLGGGNDRPDIATGVAVDSHGDAYVTGFTNSPDFPTVKPLQGFRGPTDAFITKISADGQSLIYSTHLGGGADDQAMAIAVDSSGSAYVTGHTESPDFPVTANAYRGKCVTVPSNARIGEICSGGDAFLSKLSPDGSRLVYSTFLNGSKFEVGRGVAVDSAGAAYVVGIVGSADFPQVDPVQKRYGGGEFDAFVAKFNPAGSELVYSSFIGGGGVDLGLAIAVDDHSDAYITGSTGSLDFPSRHPLKRGRARQSADTNGVFVTKISSGRNKTGEASAKPVTPVVSTLTGRIVATGVVDIRAIAAVGAFHAGGPIHDWPEFQPFAAAGGILDAERILVASGDNLGYAPGGKPESRAGAVLSIDPRGAAPARVPRAFASGADAQASADNGRVKLFTVNSEAFLNRHCNPGAVTADLPSVASPTAISINNAFGRIWVTNMPAGVSGPGLESVLDANGKPLCKAPSKIAGGVFAGEATNRSPQLAPGSLASATVGTAFLGRAPDDSGRAVFAALGADGAVTQIHVEKGVDGLAPAGTIPRLAAGADLRHIGLAFAWTPNAILYVANPHEDSIVALALKGENKAFKVERKWTLAPKELNEPVDVAPATPEIVSADASSGTTLSGGSDLYVLNRGDGSIVRLTDSGRVVAIRRIALPGSGVIRGDRLRAIAVSPDADTIFIAVDGPIGGDKSGAVIAVPAFNAAL